MRRGRLPLVTMECEIRYATDGDSGNGGMDRGRLLAAMDAELVAAVGAAPQNVVKMNYVRRGECRGWRRWRWGRMCSGAMWRLARRRWRESGWSGWRRLRCSATRKRVSCEYDGDGSWCGGGVAPVTRRVRAYFAPVNRAAGVPTVFDAAQMGAFALDSPPAPWVDLGWC